MSRGRAEDCEDNRIAISRASARATGRSGRRRKKKTGKGGEKTDEARLES